jgi:hypothetical protein
MGLLCFTLTKTIGEEHACIMKHCQIMFVNSALHEAHILLKDVSSFIEMLTQVRGREKEQWVILSALLERVKQ